MRQQLTLQLFTPVGLHVLKLYELYDPLHAEQHVYNLTFGELLQNNMMTANVLNFINEPISRALNNPEFSVLDLNVEINLKRIHYLFIRGDYYNICKTFDALSEIISCYQCDVLLLTGRPSRLPGVQSYFRSRLSIPAGRILPLHGYYTGGWYPFHKQERIDDPKTTAAVGAMLCFLSKNLRLANFYFRSANMDLYSTVKYIGLLDNLNMIKQENIYYRDIDLDDPDYDFPDLSFEIRGTTRLGFKQLEIDRWPASPIYILTIENSEVAKRLSADGAVLEVTLGIKNRQKTVENFYIKDVKASDGRTCDKTKDIKLNLNTMVNSGLISTQYWLDSGIGFFGLSQAGKSYLISALAAGENGKLETVVDNQTLDFIDHVNPVGGGKEATGLVTRFSRTAKGGIANYPLELKLFQEIEIVKILINAYFKDFDQQKVVNKIEFSELNQLIARAESKKQADYTGGITEDDIVDLYDYLSENFGNSLEGLKGGYWEKAVSLLPYLATVDRGILFSVLWGGINELTAIYVQLATTLSSLNHVNTVYAPLSVLVKENDGKKSQIDSIMNVDMLERLNTEKDSSVSVTPVNGVPTSISLAQLAFLTAELIFPLVNQTRVPTFEKVDLLDFPGYRGRLNLISISDVKEGNPIAQLLLRGKVAYLFEKYTDSQEMNVLVVCTPSDKQSDVNDVGPVLERWIDKTQGETAEKRATKKAGLLWAITMFDKRIGASLHQSEDNLSNTWGKGGLLQQTILERFGSYDWLSNWSNNGKFNNVFLVRKPGFDVPFLNVDAKANLELSYNDNYQQEMSVLKKTFVENSDIKEYVNTPDQAWDAMLKLNDGGIGRISHYLEQVAITEVKQQRIVEQLNEKIDYIINMRFDTWYQAGSDEELGKKKQVISGVVKELRKSIIIR